MLINFTVSSRLQDALGPAKLEISSVLTYFIIQPERLQRRVVAPMYSYKQRPGAMEISNRYIAGGGKNLANIVVSDFDFCLFWAHSLATICFIAKI